MPLWIPITIAAAFLQNVRSTIQKQLTGKLSTQGATYVRFMYGLPIALLYLALLVNFQDRSLSEITSSWSVEFWTYAVVGGICQILATALLVTLFTYRNFAVGTAFSKTETVQAVMFGLVFLGEGITTGAGIGIFVSLIGVILISTRSASLKLSEFLKDLTAPAALMGMGSGALFGISAVSYRGASLSLGIENVLFSASITLACVLTLQTLLMGGWLVWKDRSQLSASLRHWRPAALAGITGGLGSIGWFTAMTLQNVAYVRALGQIELVFTFAVSWFFFKERSNAKEIAGVILIVAGLVVLLLDT